MTPRAVAAAALAVALGGCAREAAPPPVDVEAALEEAAAARADAGPAGRARADSLYRAVLAVDAEQPEARHGLAGLAADGGNVWAAQWHLVRLLRTRPDHAGALSLLGLAAYAQGRLEDVPAYFERLAAQRALGFEESVALADACNKTNRFAQAESVFAGVVTRFPRIDDANASRVLEGLGYARWKRGRLDEAAEALERAAAMGNAPTTRLLLATALADLDRADEAAAALPDLTFDQAREAGILAAYFVLRNRLLLGRGSEAEIEAGARELARVAAEAPDQVNVPHLLSRMRRSLGDLEGARAAAELHAATIRTVDRRDHVRAEQDLLDGAALEAGGDAEGALEAYSRGLEVAPDNVDLLCAAGGALSSLGRKEEARGIFSRLRTLPGGESPGRQFLVAGAELRRRGLPAAAARRFEQAAARLPGEPEPVFLQALSLAEAGDWDAALRVAAPLERPAAPPPP